MNHFFVNNIFSFTAFNEDHALQLFHQQYKNNDVYQRWCSLLRITPSEVRRLEEIPFLPISFFKTHSVTTGSFSPEITFTSSGTTQTLSSRHLVKKAALYRQSFLTAFEAFYGAPKDLCIIALLPSYLERSGSSLVYMAEELVKISGHPLSGFYLYDFAKLYSTLQTLESEKQKTILIGVTFALLDFADAFHLPLQYTTLMETGGMKGRKQELTRQEVHAALQHSFGSSPIHSEYGMTELLSQAYSKGNGIYQCPPWMKVLMREEDNPVEVYKAGKGVLNIIDLANRDSIAFIATDDVGIVYENGTFEVLGATGTTAICGGAVC